jgi:hypothetical protein
MFYIVFELFYNLFILLLSIFITIFSRLNDSLKRSSSEESAADKLLRLKNERNALIHQRDQITNQLEAIDTSIQQLSAESNTIITTFDQRLDSSYSSPRRAVVVSPTERPPRPTQRTRQRLTSIGVPYPLPFTPPRTPEEERRNRVVAWVNELRLQNCTKDGDSR